uniref:Uncharacterized protein n=1 Tax=Magnetococcus massalia (strain MO-1) TaxID=451514 RepID=A0A1S7LLE4_MAGMO|nr:protein of unknown function [Candidatus Magnetococcus massalia]
MGEQVLFEAVGGISIGVDFITGSGAPGGAGGNPDSAVKGSLYMDQTNGQIWVKQTDGAGTDKWGRLQAQDDLDAALLGQSWREPAQVHDATGYADMAEAETAINTTSIDGITVSDGDRVLFTGITGANQNIYLVTGTPGAGATLSEDGNDATEGDALYVQGGTDAGKQYVYNGSAWILQGAASSTEIAFLQSFIGKSGDGNETPDYLSNHVVTDGESLEKAIGDLDGSIGAGISTPQGRTTGAISDQAVNLNVEQLDDAIGPDVTSTNQLTATDSVNANLSTLDAAVGGDVATPQLRTSGTVSVQATNLNIEALDDAIGADVTSTHFTTAANSINANISALDVALGDAFTENAVDGVTALATLDEVLVDEVAAVEWVFHARSVTTPSKVLTGKILAFHNGSGGSDATKAKFNRFGVMRIGGNISGFDFDVDLDGVGVAQTMRLRAQAGEAMNLRIVRTNINQ